MMGICAVWVFQNACLTGDLVLDLLPTVRSYSVETGIKLFKSISIFSMSICTAAITSSVICNIYVV